jgi:hypothetical protein
MNRVVVIGDDKRLISDDEIFWTDRQSVHKWRYCKYCYRNTPQFLFRCGLYGSCVPTQVLRCCWECGSGLEQIEYSNSKKRNKIGV